MQAFCAVIYIFLLDGGPLYACEGWPSVKMTAFAVVESSPGSELPLLILYCRFQSNPAPVVTLKKLLKTDKN
jgi:hypothetical protein